MSVVPQAAEAPSDDAGPVDVTGGSSAGARRRAYVKPELVWLGSVADLTLGQSGGRRIDVGSRNRF